LFTPICFRENQMGFPVFDQKSDIGDAYEDVTNQLHKTLQRIELLEDFERAEDRLVGAIDDIAGKIKRKNSIDF
jgi:cell fate (sporulation/competence/biofilm development) regulator YlbF (YheA/YmcA/DUF963 family)